VVLKNTFSICLTFGGVSGGGGRWLCRWRWVAVAVAVAVAVMLERWWEKLFKIFNKTVKKNKTC